MRSAFPIEIQPNISHVSPSKSSAGLDDLEGARDRERERKSCREREVILWQIFEPEEEEEGDRRRHWRDETIEKSLDTGDLLFFNYECNQLFTPEQVITCHKQKILKSLGE